MTVPHDCHYSLAIGILSFPILLRQILSRNLHVFLLTMHLYLFSRFGAGSGTLNVVPSEIFVFNRTTGVKPYSFSLLK